jgi:hypothetical protein
MKGKGGERIVSRFLLHALIFLWSCEKARPKCKLPSINDLWDVEILKIEVGLKKVFVS